MKSDDSTKTASLLYEDIRKRFAKNVILKFYKHLLEPTIYQLRGVLRDNIVTLSDESIKQVFETDAFSEDLIRKKKAALSKLQACESLESQCDETLTSFLEFRS